MGLQAPLERLGDDELGLRQRPFGRIDQDDRTVDHRQNALDLTAEIGVAGRVDDLMRVSCQTSDVHLARIVMPRSRSRSLRIHGPLGDLLVFAETRRIV